MLGGSPQVCGYSTLPRLQGVRESRGRGGHSQHSAVRGRPSLAVDAIRTFVVRSERIPGFGMDEQTARRKLNYEGSTCCIEDSARKETFSGHISTRFRISILFAHIIFSQMVPFFMRHIRLPIRQRDENRVSRFPWILAFLLLSACITRVQCLASLLFRLIFQVLGCGCDRSCCAGRTRAGCTSGVPCLGDWL